VEKIVLRLFAARLFLTDDYGTADLDTVICLERYGQNPDEVDWPTVLKLDAAWHTN
jgi:hypothetical protein